MTDLQQRSTESKHDYAMRMRLEAVRMGSVRFQDPGPDWYLRLIQDAKNGKILLPIQEQILMKKLKLSFDELREFLASK